MAVRFVIREQLEDAVGDLGSAVTLDEALADAADVSAYIAANPWVTETALRTWGENQDIGPDRMNAALAVLDASTKVVRTNITEAQIPAAPAGGTQDG